MVARDHARRHVCFVGPGASGRTANGTPKFPSCCASIDSTAKAENADLSSRSRAADEAFGFSASSFRSDCRAASR